MNKYLLLFLIFFSSLDLASAAEVNLDRIRDEIPDGCSNEVIDWLKNPDGPEDSVGELITDTLTSACIRFKEPEESIKLMQSVRNRIVNLEIPEDADQETIGWMYALYAFYWFEPYLSNGLIEESKALFTDNLAFFNELKKNNKLDNMNELIATFLYLEEYVYQVGYDSFSVKSLKYLVSRVPLDTKPFQKEYNSELAALLLDVRIALISGLISLQDLDSLAGELSIFNKIYLNNIVDQKIVYKEFADTLGDAFKDIEITDENKEELGLSLIREIPEYLPTKLIPIGTAITYFRNSYKRFPARDEITYNYAKLNITMLDQSIDALINLDNLIGHYTNLLTDSINAELKTKICQLFFDINGSNKSSFNKRPKKIDDYHKHLRLLSIETGCNPNPDTIIALRLMSEKFIDDFEREIKESKINIFSDEDEGNPDLYDVGEVIFSSLIASPLYLYVFGIQNDVLDLSK